jgi:hypothetical protein
MICWAVSLEDGNLRYNILQECVTADSYKYMYSSSIGYDNHWILAVLTEF